jgi:3' terminal RNA ribose 2'-O-methyltransferase Hen1
LGFLLHKNPGRVQVFSLSFGRATVFYPEASEARCTVCLLVEVDPMPMGLVRFQTGIARAGTVFGQYVNDRPYVASSLLSVAISEVFGSGLAGRSKDRPDLAAQRLPFEVMIPGLPSPAGEPLIRALFEPLGYGVLVERLPLDPTFPEWGPSRCFHVTLTGTQRLQDLLRHLNVLIPVLDDEKHYWVGDDEVEKLLRRGGDWLPGHPAQEIIARRYLKHQRDLTRQAIARLTAADGREPNEDGGRGTATPGQEASAERTISLNSQRLSTIAHAVRDSGATSVVDLGCGDGRLLRELAKQPQLTRLVGMDVSLRTLDYARERLHLDERSPTFRDRIALIHGSLVYRDRRLQGFDVATVIEVIEHLDAARLSAFERVLFGEAKPKAVLLTTPNADYNVHFGSLPAGKFRHPDHRFEWTRNEFETWCRGVATRFGYRVKLSGIGDPDPALGTPTQMAWFDTA